MIQTLCFPASHGFILLFLLLVFETMLCFLFPKSFNANSTFFLFFRSSLPEVFWKKGVLRNFAKFTGKNLCQSLRPATLLKKEPLAQVFFCEFCEISKNTISYRTPPVAPSVFLNVSFVTSHTLHFTLFTSTSTLFFCF